MVSHARGKRQPLQGCAPLGQNVELAGSAAACRPPSPTPPVISLTTQPMDSRPTMITIICTKSVSATDHMPPHMV